MMLSTRQKNREKQQIVMIDWMGIWEENLRDNSDYMWSKIPGMKVSDWQQ